MLILGIMILLVGCKSPIKQSKTKVLSEEEAKSIVNNLYSINDIPDEILNKLQQEDKVPFERVVSFLSEYKKYLDKNGNVKSEAYEYGYFYAQSYLIENRVEERINIIKELELFKYKSPLTGINILHLAIIYRDVDVFREFFDKDIFVQGIFQTNTYSPLHLLLCYHELAKTSEFIEVFKEDKELISLFLVYCCFILRDDLVQHLLNNISVDVNKIIRIAIPEYDDVTQTKFFFGVVTLQERFKGIKSLFYSAIGGMTNKAIRYIVLSKYKGLYGMKSYIETPTVLPTIRGKKLDNRLFEKDQLILSVLTKSIFLRVYDIVENKQEDDNKKFANIINMLIEKGYNIEKDDMYEEIYTDFVKKMGNKATIPLLKAGYPVLEPKRRQQKRHLYQFPMGIEEEYNKEFFEFIKENLQLPSDSLELARELIEMAKSSSNNPVIHFVIRFANKFGLKKKTKYSINRSSNTFLTHLMAVEENTDIQELIDLAKKNLFITTEELKKLKSERRAQSIKESLSLSEEFKREEAERDRLRKEEEDNRKRREYEQNRDKRRPLDNLSVNFSEVSPMSKEHKEELFFDKIYMDILSAEDFLLIKELVKDISEDKLLEIELAKIGDERAIKLLLNREDILLTEALMKNIIQKDQKKAMDFIIKNRKDEAKGLFDNMPQSSFISLSDSMIDILSPLEIDFSSGESESDSLELYSEEETFINVYMLPEVDSEIRNLGRKELRWITNALDDVKGGRFKNTEPLSANKYLYEIKASHGSNGNWRIYYYKKTDDIFLLKIFDKKESVPLEKIRIAKEKLEAILENEDLESLVKY